MAKWEIRFQRFALSFWLFTLGHCCFRFPLAFSIQPLAFVTGANEKFHLSPAGRSSHRYQYYNTRNRPVHDVPERDVRRRFNRSLKNLFALYRPLLDTLHCFDNSSDTPRLIFKDELGHTVIGDAALYDQLRRKFAP
jgi:hypothetical protein